MSEFQVLIAEDEPSAARYIRSVVEETKLFSAVTVCESAEDALALLREKKIDVLITDIKMSGMSGIDLLRSVHDLCPQMRSIIISGYSSFSFAKDAISLGVYSYILKPINNEELIDALQKICQELDQERRRSNEDLMISLRKKSEQYLDAPQTLPFATYNVLMIAGSFDQQALAVRCRKEFRLQDDGPVCFLLYRYALVILEDGSAASEQRLPRIANSILAWEAGSGNSGLLVLSEEQWKREDFTKNLRAIYGFHQRNMRLGKIRLLFYQDKAPAPTYDLAREKGFVDILLQDLNVRNDKDFYRNFHRLFAFWEENNVSLHTIKQGVYRIIIHLFHLDSNQIDPIIEINKIMGKLYTCTSYEQAQSCVASAVEPLLGRLSIEHSTTQSQSQEMFWKITDFLNTHIQNNYSLQEISDTFGISQPYVSKLFRMYSGSSYKEYVTDRKITTAIKLMEQQRNMLIKDIAEKVGYDQLYFSTVFYRVTGEYPKQYREKIGSRPGENKNQKADYEKSNGGF